LKIENVTLEPLVWAKVTMSTCAVMILGHKQKPTQLKY